MRVPEYNKQVAPDVTSGAPRLGVIHIPQADGNAHGQISKSLAGASAALSHTPEISGAERLYDYAARAAAALGAYAEKQQAQNDEMDFHLFKAKSDNEFFNIMEDISKNGHYSEVVKRGNEMLTKMLTGSLKI